MRWRWRWIEQAIGFGTHCAVRRCARVLQSCKLQKRSTSLLGQPSEWHHGQVWVNQRKRWRPAAVLRQHGCKRWKVYRFEQCFGRFAFRRRCKQIRNGHMACWLGGWLQGLAIRLATSSSSLLWAFVTSNSLRWCICTSSTSIMYRNGCAAVGKADYLDWFHRQDLDKRDIGFFNFYLAKLRHEKLTPQDMLAIHLRN